MPSSTTFTVALVLTAVNSMSSAVNQSINNLRQYGNQVSQVTNQVSKYEKQLNALEKSAARYEQIKNTGARDIQTGLFMAVPVEETLRKAGQFEAVMKKVENALYDSTVPASELQRQMGELTKQAIELGNQTTFSNMEAAQAQLALLKNGMQYQDVLQGGATAAMYLAQTAEIAPAAAADAVSQITNMFQLQGNQLLQVADDINRAANASSAGVQNIMHDLQQTGMSAHTLGLKVKETTLMLGVLHNMGLADASGTYLNDMLINLDKMTPKARKALQAMGWLEGATVKTMSSGNIKVIGGSNSLFDEKGQIRSAEVLVQKLRQVLYNNPDLKPEEMRDKAGNLLPQEEIEKLLQAKNKLEALQQLKDVFGIQGMRAAIAMATPGKGSYEEMVGKAERAKRIQDQVLEWQDILLGKIETLKGSWDTLMTQTGSPLTNEVGGIVKDTTQVVNAVSSWANENPKVVASIVRILGVLALVKISIGGAKFLFGGLGGFLNSTAGVMLRLTRSAMGFVETFRYFRQGTTFFRALWAAVAFGRPILLRIGAAWIVALGPVGWIIGGVTLAVIAAVAAWKSNFLGFQDVAISVIEKFMSVVNKVRRFMGLSIIELDILKKGAGDFKMLEYEKPPVVKTPGAGDDNRKFDFYIQSTDPEGAAAEVSSVLGGPGMDKYKRSRDPRLQTDDFAYGGVL